MIFSIRDVKAEDQVRIIDCDIKCFDIPWTPDDWALAGEYYTIRVATYYGTAIGFVVCHQDADSNIVYMPKLCVTPAFRRKGVGFSLVKEAIKFAQKAKATRIETLLPESILRPQEPAFVGEWMNKVGFKAVGIVPQIFQAMGQKEDGVTFILSL